MTNPALRNAVIAATLLQSGVALPVQAQGGAMALEEIVVTAQRREQSVQDIPISIEAFSNQQIDDYRITNFTDLATIVPNLSAVEGAGGTRAVVFQIRGLYANCTALAADCGIATYLDGVYLAGGSGSMTDYADLERVEVLRGPQGTLFGRNTSGGAIHFVTPDPRGEFGFRQTFTAGNLDLFESRTRIDTPQMGPVSASLNYSYREREGDVDNLGAGFVVDWTDFGGGRYKSPQRLNDEEVDSVLLSLSFDLHEDLRLVYKYDYMEVDTASPPVGILAYDPDVLSGLAPFIESSISTTRPGSVNNAFHTETYSENSGHNLTAEYQINEDLTFRNIFAYRENYVEVPGQTLDGIGQFAPAVIIYFVTGGRDTEQLSNETQLIWDTEDFTLTSGFLYYGYEAEQGGLPGTTAPNAIFGGQPTSFVPGVLEGERSEAEVDSYAVYGQLEYQLNEQWQAVLGGRFTNDKKDYVDRTLPTEVLEVDYDEDETTYLLGLNYMPSDDVMLYAKFSTGYISGGLVSGLAYEPEKAESFEVGAKATWLDGTLRTNLAVFSVDYEQQQFGTAGTLVEPPVPAAQVLVNAGDNQARGFELETTWLPVANTTLGMSLGYLDFEFKSVDFDLLGGPISPHLRPEWSGTAYADYVTEPLVGNAAIRIHVAASYRSDEWTTTRPVPWTDDDETGETWRLNARMALEGIELGKGEISITAWGRNLTDSDEPTNMNTLGPLIAGYYEAPRTYGIDLTYEF